MTTFATRNVTRVFREAARTPQLNGMIDGQSWYWDAHNLAQSLANQYAVSVERAAAVIAVISPRLPWPQNVKAARLAFDLAHGQGVINRNAFVRALPILDSNAGKAYDLLLAEFDDDIDTIVSGPKVRAFWRTIVDPYDARAVVIDRHAIDVAVGHVMTDAERGRILGRKGAYDSVASCYRRAAAIITRERGESWSPAMVQAVTWTYWRRVYAVANHGG